MQLHGYFTTEKKVADALERLKNDDVILDYFHYRPGTDKDREGIDFEILLYSNHKMPLQVKGNPEQCRLHRRKYGRKIPVVNANCRNLIQEIYRLIQEYDRTESLKNPRLRKGKEAHHNP